MSNKVSIQICLTKTFNGEEFVKNHLDLLTLEQFDLILRSNEYIQRINDDLEDAINHLNNETNDRHY